MRAALLSAPEKIEISETDVPDFGENEVLIKPIRTGICGSDVSLFSGHRKPSAYPLVPGHEVVGHVTAAGKDVTQISVGQRVIVEPNYPCGVCAY